MTATSLPSPLIEALRNTRTDRQRIEELEMRCKYLEEKIGYFRRATPGAKVVLVLIFSFVLVCNYYGWRYFLRWANDDPLGGKWDDVPASTRPKPIEPKPIAPQIPADRPKAFEAPKPAESPKPEEKPKDKPRIRPAEARAEPPAAALATSARTSPPPAPQPIRTYYWCNRCCCFHAY